LQFEIPKLIFSSRREINKLQNRFEIPNYSNKNIFSRCKIITSKLKFQVVLIKMTFRGKITISELKFQVAVIKMIFPHIK
jgi:hypothetical protein